jgi:hypothetical protein
LTDQEAKGVAGLRNKLAASDWAGSPLVKDTSRLVKFLRARDYDVDKAYDQFVTMLKWRKEYKPEDITEEEVKRYADLGSSMWLPMRDKLGREVLLIFGGLHIPAQTTHEETFRFVVRSVEQRYKAAPPGSDWQILVINDRLGFTRQNFDREALGNLIKILSQYYPEIVGDILVLRVNWLFWVLWKIVSIFFDPKMTSKITIGGSDAKADVLKFFDEQNLWSFYGGPQKWQAPNTNYLKLAGLPEEANAEETEEAKKIAAEYAAAHKK